MRHLTRLEQLEYLIEFYSQEKELYEKWLQAAIEEKESILKKEKKDEISKNKR